MEMISLRGGDGSTPLPRPGNLFLSESGQERKGAREGGDGPRQLRTWLSLHQGPDLLSVAQTHEKPGHLHGPRLCSRHRAVRRSPLEVPSSGVPTVEAEAECGGQLRGPLGFQKRVGDPEPRQQQKAAPPGLGPRRQPARSPPSGTAPPPTCYHSARGRGEWPDVQVQLQVVLRL